jgi:hypothetical protein
MLTREGWQARWAALVLTLFLAAVGALHMAVWVEHPPDTDPLNFRAALTDYDVGHDRPHPPGYPLFVGLGRLFALAVGPAHAFQAVGLMLMLAAALFLYAALAARGLRWVGLGAAVLLASHPLAWSATLAGESYMADAAFSCAVFWVATARRGRPVALVTALFLMMLLLGLFRPVSVVLLACLALACIWSGEDARVRRSRLLAGTLAVAAAFLVAYGLTVAVAGGMAVYREATGRVMAASFRGVSVLGGAPVAVHAQMVAKLVGWALALALPALAVWALLALRTRRDPPVPRPAQRLWRIVVAWVAPPFCFYASVYYLKPAYQLIYLPAFLLAFAWGVARLCERGRGGLGVAVVACLAALQLAFFFANGNWPQPIQRQTYAYLKRQDDASAKLVAFLSGMPPGARVLWLGHGELNVYSLRLVPQVGRVAVYDETRQTLQLLDPGRMDWGAPADRLDGLAAVTALYIVRAGPAGTSLRVLPLGGPKVLDVPLVKAVLAAPAATPTPPRPRSM